MARGRNLMWALVVVASVHTTVAVAGTWTLIGWNNLGMHCMDGDYTVLSLLPPYNTIHAQLIDPQGRIVASPAGITVTYEATADPDGSINTTSAGKTNFWDHVLALFGTSLPVDVGLTGLRMPGPGNGAKAMSFDVARGWFIAEGVPITPYDDAGNKNPYPLMHLVARSPTGTILATTDIVLPVSDEMDCKTCHASTAGPAARPAAGWVNDPDPQHDMRLNILRLHDERQTGDSIFSAALATVGYDAAGLYATVTTNGKSILCASCHLSEALPGSGQPGIRPLTQAIHGRHAAVVDPLTQRSLDATDNRSACYRCHPGSETKCLRGAMGVAVAPDGTLAMQCQSCHGTMTTVAAPTRTGWLNEPTCQNCHSGTATRNNGQIRYTSVFDAPAHLRQAVDQTFATNPNQPAAGLSLYRFSYGHGGLACEACHGSTHAEFPSSHRNDNIQSVQRQGHVGLLVECASCHGTQPVTVSGGPHGMHPVGQSWVSQHPDAVEQAGASACTACHGADLRGTVLSRSQADRTISAFGSKRLWRGFQVGCYTCHAGPDGENANPNRAPTVQDVRTTTPVDTSLRLGLIASDADRDPLTLRVVSQPGHGTVALSGTAATYYPDGGFTGTDTFTFAAWDGSTDSNLGTATVDVGGAPGCTYGLTPTARTFGPGGGSDSVAVTTAVGCPWTARSDMPWLTVTSPGAGGGNGAVGYAVAPNTSSAARTATLAIGSATFTVTEAGLGGTGADLTAQWLSLTQRCIGAEENVRCRLRGKVLVVNQGSAPASPSLLRCYLSATPAVDNGATLLKEAKIPSQRAGQARKKGLGVRLQGGSASGQYVIAVVDATNAVAEMDETNNAVSFGPLP
ncbi:MAG: Ig-like domain-containing protein [Candidatus Binatia bacterium]